MCKNVGIFPLDLISLETVLLILFDSLARTLDFKVILKCSSLLILTTMSWRVFLTRCFLQNMIFSSLALFSRQTIQQAKDHFESKNEQLNCFSPKTTFSVLTWQDSKPFHCFKAQQSESWRNLIKTQTLIYRNKLLFIKKHLKIHIKLL